MAEDQAAFLALQMVVSAGSRHPSRDSAPIAVCSALPWSLMHLLTIDDTRFTVIIPAIIQDVLNDQKLPIKGGALQALTPDRLEMAVDTSLSCPIGVNLDPLDLSLYNKNMTPMSPFLSLAFPKLHIKGTTEVNVTEQTMDITNQTELLSWFNEFFDKPKVQLSVKGKPRIHLGSLKYSRSLDKTIDVPSLNYLDGFGVKNQQFDLSNTTKYNMKGTLNIPNSGVLTLGLGDLQFNVESGNLKLGLINIYDLQLKPGNNSVPFEGNFFFNELVPNLKEVLDTQKGPLGNGYFEFFATGNTTMINGKHIPYIEGVLNRKRIRFTIPVITLLGDVVGGMLGSVGADQSSLLDVFGEAIGNSTLFENLLDHWDNETKNNDKKATRSVEKRQKGGKSWMLNLLRLGLRTRKG